MHESFTTICTTYILLYLAHNRELHLCNIIQARLQLYGISASVCSLLCGNTLGRTLSWGEFVMVTWFRQYRVFAERLDNCLAPNVFYFATVIACVQCRLRRCRVVKRRCMAVYEPMIAIWQRSHAHMVPLRVNVRLVNISHRLHERWTVQHQTQKLMIMSSLCFMGKRTME